MAEAVKQEKQKLSGRQVLILISIMTMYFFAPTFGAVSSTLTLMPSVYGISASTVSYISVIASPAACIAGLFIGAIAGKKLSYKACAIVSMSLFTVFGGLPFLWQSIPFGWLLVSRLLFGLGCGCINPLVQAIITHMFKNETVRSAWIGIINIIFSVGASVGSMITGVLALSGWQNAYAFYLFAVVPLVFAILFLKDSEIIGKDTKSDDVAETKTAATEKRHIPGAAWGYIIIFMFSTIITQVFFSYAGIAMGERGLNTALIGTVFTVFTVAGIAVAALNALVWKKFRLWNLPIAYALFVIGYVVCLLAYSSSSIALFFVASIIIGIGCCLAGMVMPMLMSVTCTAGTLTLAIGFQEVARNLGSFLSSPWLQGVAGIFGESSTAQFTAIIVLSAIVTVIAFIVAAKNNKKFKNIETEK